MSSSCLEKARSKNQTGTSGGAAGSIPSSGSGFEPADRIEQPVLNVVMHSPKSLRPYSGNARTHSKKQIKQIANSIERFGFTNPVLIDDEDMILAGHGRVAAALMLELDEVPCIRLSAMSEVDKRAYILADNKLAQNAGWDDELVAIELQFLLEAPDEIDISITGFSIAEIDGLIDIGGADTTEQDEEDDQLPAIVDGAVAITRNGDLWQLGKHRLICGDARNEDTYQLLMQGRNGQQELAQMVFTDPPYNVPINGHVSGKGAIKHREFAMASGEMDSNQFTDFLSSTFECLATYSQNGSIHFICMDWRHMDELRAAGDKVYSELKNLIIWVKDNGGMGSFYRSRHELIFAFKNGDAPHINSFELGQHGRYRTNVWNYRGITSATKASREELALHPTVKPVAMVADAMKDCCERGGLVLDAFCGSGTVLIAAQKTGRRARAIEIDPLYCDTAIKRWQSFASDDAILLATGETFEQVSVRRRSEQSGSGNNEAAGTSKDVTLHDREATPALQNNDAGHAPTHSDTNGIRLRYSKSASSIGRNEKDADVKNIISASLVGQDDSSPNTNNHRITKSVNRRSTNNHSTQKNSNCSPWASPITETKEQGQEDG